jgi:hypothetical protein
MRFLEELVLELRLAMILSQPLARTMRTRWWSIFLGMAILCVVLPRMHCLKTVLDRFEVCCEVINLSGAPSP